MKRLTEKIYRNFFTSAVKKGLSSLRPRGIGQTSSPRRAEIAKNAQGIIEYVVLLCIVLAALLVMGHYLRNSLSGKQRESADVFGSGEVYELSNTTVTYTAYTNYRE
jgi:hypothetical protein